MKRNSQLTRQEKLEQKRQEMASSSKTTEGGERDAKDASMTEAHSTLESITHILVEEGHTRRKQVVINDNHNEVMMRLLVMAFYGEITQGQLIRLLRRDVLGYSQDQFVELTKVNRRTLSKIEGDNGKPNLSLLLGLLKPFGLELAIVPKNKGMKEKLVTWLKNSLFP